MKIYHITKNKNILSLGIDDIAWARLTYIAAAQPLDDTSLENDSAKPFAQRTQEHNELTKPQKIP